MRHLVGLLIGLVAIIAALPAFAQACGPRDAIVERLASGYDEVVRMRGLSATGKMLEVYVAPSGTWTVLITTSDGTSCLVNVGEQGQIIPATEGDPA